MTFRTALLVLLLVEVPYSLSFHVSCNAPDLPEPDIIIQRHDEFHQEYEDEYPNPEPEVERQDPCKSVSTVRVVCPYAFYATTDGYSLSNTVCPNDRFAFYFDNFTHIEENGWRGYGGVKNITVLRGSSFKANFKISELHLDNFSIVKITPGAFNYQSTIDSIFLRANNLSMITVGIFNSLTHLHTLDLSENQIENISEDAFSSVPLTKLLLSRNKLTSVPDVLFDIRNLDVSYNRLEQISLLRKFETRILDLSNNNIKYFNSTCFPMLEELYLASNKLEQIELNISKIRKLDVSNNGISSYPENSESLVWLNLGGNEISVLPNKSVHGDALIHLYLYLNYLTYIPSIFFKELISLETLDLSGNKLSSFKFGTFDNLLSLTYLNISHNNFKTLPIYTLHALKNLQYIYFSDNEITDFNVEDLFKHLPHLRKVDFKGNMLSCQNLLNVVHKLKDHLVDFQRGNFTEGDNIYGIKCTSTFTGTNMTLPSTFYEDLRNSSFARYLESLSRVPLSQNQQILDRLLDMDKKQNEVLDKIVTRLNLSGEDQGTFQKILLRNLSLGNEDFAKELREIVNKTQLTSGTYKELLTRYADASNVMKNISLDILEADKEQNELLNRLISEQSNKGDTSKTISYPSNNFTTMEKFISILNNTDRKQNEVIKVYSSLGSDVKKALEALEKSQVSLGHFIEGLLRNNQIENNSFLVFPDNTEKTEALHAYSEKNDSDGKQPVFIFIALLLTTMTILMFSLLYIVFYRVKYIVNNKPDVEMNQLIESKSDIVSN
ncbi:unnamed protein product [Callosobruchus maculatus]|uniref:Uncharacterized protein n=1 Tax=Callosobruchus maculatus TaxID=64391 RepID=A0A653BWV7_CALMS|nr:unnamed protein product [Callosobruchus maculatus]